jgi:DNA-binding CsgD family transcriptional regulator
MLSAMQQCRAMRLENIMSRVTLSSADVSRLTTVCSTAVAPFSFPSLTAWRVAVREQLVALLGADRSLSQLHLEGEPPLESPREVAPAMEDYVAYYHQFDTGLAQRRRDLGLEVVPVRKIYDLQKLTRTEIWNEWSSPHHLFDALAITVDVPGVPAPAGFWFYHEYAQSPTFGHRGEVLLQLALPAVKAGLQSVHQLDAHQRELMAAMERLQQPALLVDRTGNLLYRNAPCGQLLHEESERQRVEAEIRRLAVRVAAVVERRALQKSDTQTMDDAPSCDIRTSRGLYRMTATWLRPGLIAPRGTVLVMLARRAGGAPDPRPFAARYRLTVREMEVLQLLRRGTSVPEVAGHLGVSRHTARHHVEALRTKLGVRRISQIVAMLADEA